MSGAPPIFREPKGTYWRTWRCRWKRLRCALGLHTWWLGPYAVGDPPRVVRDTVTGEPYRLGPGQIAEFCGGGRPGCKAWRIRKVAS